MSALLSAVRQVLPSLIIMIALALFFAYIDYENLKSSIVTTLMSLAPIIVEKYQTIRKSDLAPRGRIVEEKRAEPAALFPVTSLPRQSTKSRFREEETRSDELHFTLPRGMLRILAVVALVICLLLLAVLIHARFIF